jgi:hypothetical protein
VAQPSHPAPEPASAIGGTELRERYGDRWRIACEAPGVWSAERRSPDGRSLRYICAETPAELAAKLATAEVVVP